MLEIHLKIRKASKRYSGSVPYSCRCQISSFLLAIVFRGGEQLAARHELHIPARAPAGDNYSNFCPSESLGCFPVASGLGFPLNPLMSHSMPLGMSGIPIHSLSSESDPWPLMG